MPYRCRVCGYQSPKWLGRCPQCGSWDSFEEIPSEKLQEKPEEGASWIGARPQSLVEVKQPAKTRIATGIGELDRLLGGGLLPGSVILFGGEPGIGKSTLLLQIAQALAAKGQKVLYVSGEESPAQIKLRAERLGINEPELYLYSEQDLARIVQSIDELEPQVLIVDSLQTVVARSGGDVGGVAQVREAASQLARIAKALSLTCFLVSHITKGGEFAGPKTVEHLVDVAVYLEGTREGDLRILRSVKNRFGSTNEVAVFQMGETGLVEVPDPSTFFVSRDRPDNPGAVVVPVLEGSRPLLVEVQALVAPSMGYGPPQRRMAGLDYNRVLVLLAVMEKRLGVHIGAMDVYLAVAGGLELRETALDLGIFAAVLSSLQDKVVPSDTVVFGEVGLAGDVRPVRKGPERLREVDKLGFRRAIVPPFPAPRRLSLQVEKVKSIVEAASALGFE